MMNETVYDRFFIAGTVEEGREIKITRSICTAGRDYPIHIRHLIISADGCKDDRDIFHEHATMRFYFGEQIPWYEFPVKSAGMAQVDDVTSFFMDIRQLKDSHGNTKKSLRIIPMECFIWKVVFDVSVVFSSAVKTGITMKGKK